MWVVFEPFTVEEAIDALRAVLPAIDQHLATGDIEVVTHAQWYLQGGAFDLQRVITAWGEKLSQALARGYAGVRANGNEAWLTERDWTDFSAYEEKLNALIATQPMLILCTYPLATTSAADLFDVARTHHFAITKRHGRWEMLETPELTQAKAEIRKLNQDLEQRVMARTRELAATNKALRREISERRLTQRRLVESEQSYRSLFENSLVGIAQALPDGRLHRVNHAFAHMYGYCTPQEMLAAVTDIGQQLYVHPEERQAVEQSLAANGEMGPRALLVRRCDGACFPVLATVRQVRDTHGLLLYAHHTHIDLSAQVQTEQALQASQQLTQATLNSLSAHICVLDEAGVIIAVNNLWERFAEANGTAIDKVGAGINYLHICEATQGEERSIALAFAAGIRAVVQGQCDYFSGAYL